MDTPLDRETPLGMDSPSERYSPSEMDESLERWKQFTSFQFLKLPFEIRVMIWRVSLHPRIIQPTLQKRYGGFRPSVGFHASYRVELPVALRVCRESRAAVDQMYVHCFGSFLNPPHIRVNFELDTVFLSKNLSEDMALFLGVLTSVELSNLQYFAFDRHVHLLGDSDYQEPGKLSALERAVRAMTALKELIVVYSMNDVNWELFPTSITDFTPRFHDEWPRFEDEALNPVEIEHFSNDDQDTYGHWTSGKLHQVYTIVQAWA
jgi:hypothetical protein